MNAANYIDTLSSIIEEIQENRFNLENDLYYADPLSNEINDKLMECTIIMNDIVDMIGKCEFSIKEN